MVFHNNTLILEHENGARIEFNPMEALKRVRNEKLGIKVSCSQEWNESRPKENTTEKVKPFDWTFSTDYQGTTNESFRIESSNLRIDMFKLMKRETILFYHDLTLFEDELHDNGTSLTSVKIVMFKLIYNFFIHVNQHYILFAACNAIRFLHFIKKFCAS